MDHSYAAGARLSIAAATGVAPEADAADAAGRPARPAS
jgi:hypothetical protein